jgi:FKBP-type peptidyl-prolyl cis-trans isomerase
MASDEVTVNYEGRLLDGTVFDSSERNGRPATFPLNQVISGWTEGLQLMQVGARYRFFIPSELAYGPNPRPGAIGPNATLVFDVELLAINGQS